MPVDSAMSCSSQSPKPPESSKTTLSRPFLPARAEREPELERRIAVGDAARVVHLLGAGQQPSDVDAGQRRRNEPEDRKRRVAPADRGLPGHRRHAALARKGFQRRAGIGDDEERLGPPSASLPEVVEMAAGLHGRPRLRRDDEERSRRSPTGEARPDASYRARPAAPRPAVRSRAGRGSIPPSRRRQPAPGGATRRGDRAPPPADASAAARRAIPANAPRRVPSRLSGHAPRSAREAPRRRAQAVVSSPCFWRIPSSASANESENFSTPSRSSVSVTSS